MMLISASLCLLAASTALAFPAETKAGGCPGGYEEGNEIERGRLIFVCQGGLVVPKGCIAEDLSRISVGSNFDNGKYRRQCKLGSDGLQFEASGCLQNGQEHAGGSTWEDGSNFYECKVNSAGAEPAMLAVNKGCVEGGKRVNVKETVVKEDALYECQEAPNGGNKLVQAGCVKDGKSYKAGEAFESGKYWFNCTRTGREKVAVKAAGCVNGGKRLNDGDRYFENDVIFECMIENDKTSVRTTGCVQSDGGSTVERKLGCTWVEGQEPFQYEWTCKADEGGQTASKVQVRCNYKVGGGVYNIEPGCYRVVEKAAYGCIQDGKSLKLQSFQGDNAEQSASGAGLHAC